MCAVVFLIQVSLDIWLFSQSFNVKFSDAENQCTANQVLLKMNAQFWFWMQLPNFITFKLKHNSHIVHCHSTNDPVVSSAFWLVCQLSNRTDQLMSCRWRCQSISIAFWILTFNLFARHDTSIQTPPTLVHISKKKTSFCTKTTVFSNNFKWFLATPMWNWIVFSAKFNSNPISKL